MGVAPTAGHAGAKDRPRAVLVKLAIACAAYGVELTPENGPQSLVGGAALPTAVLSEGEFSKSNMSSSVSANRSRRVKCGWSSPSLLNGTMKRLSISASTEV